MKIRKEYIPMSNAHVNQNTTGAEKTDWIIRANKTEKLLGVLPKKLNETEVFSILGIIRKYEEEAFNVGINFGKEKYKNVFAPQIAQLKEINRLAGIENERLADALEKEQNKMNINNKN